MKMKYKKNEKVKLNKKNLSTFFLQCKSWLRNTNKIKKFLKYITFFFFFLFRKPADLHNLAPGTHPPFLTYNGEVKTDINKIEEFLEEVLAPPK